MNLLTCSTSLYFGAGMYVYVYICILLIKKHRLTAQNESVCVCLTTVSNLGLDIVPFCTILVSSEEVHESSVSSLYLLSHDIFFKFFNIKKLEKFVWMLYR